jgi:Carbohydrate binding module (family 6)/Glycosyl hydrolases family 16
MTSRPDLALHRRLPERWRTRAPLVAAAAALLAVGSFMAVSAQASVPPTPSGWNLAFSDDFNGASNTGVNTGNWLYDLGHSYPGGAGNWGTGEVENMTNSTTNIFQDGAGHLVIKPIRDGAGNWTSGRIETQRTDFAAPAGGKLRIQASLQQPNVSGAAAAGYWPAFWSMGAAARPVGATNWPSIGEIDIMEDINGRGSVFSTLHCGNTAAGGPCNETTGIGSGERACSGCQTGYHTYTMEYDRSVSPEQIRWYLDGNNYFTINANQVDATTWNNATHHGFFVILNVAMGGGFPAAFGGGPTAATQSGVPMLVDYVAVYTSAGGTTTPPTTAPPTTGPPTGGRDAYATIQAESFNAQSGVATETTTDTGGGQNIGWLANGDWARYDNVNFGSTPPRDFVARVASGAAGGVSGLIEVRLDSTGNAPIGSFALANTGGWQSWVSVPGNVAAATGTHTVYLTFTSGQPADFVNLNWLLFRH